MTFPLDAKATPCYIPPIENAVAVTHGHRPTTPMKKEIHPTYYPDAKVECACGNAFTVGSTTKELNIELCANCHPFYTGKQKLVDTARRVEKFQDRTTKKSAAVVSATDKKVKEAARKAKKAAK